MILLFGGNTNHYLSILIASAVLAVNNFLGLFNFALRGIMTVPPIPPISTLFLLSYTHVV